MSPRPARRLLKLLALSSLLPLAARSTAPAHAATLTVTGTGDTVAVDGSVTLREAITSINAAANANADVVPVGAYGTSDAILFAIPGAGAHTITVGATPLPTIVRPVTINGYSQPGSSANTLAVGDDAVLNIVLAGTTAGVHGLNVGVGASGTVIRGLVFQNHFFALQIAEGNVTIAGNFIGTNATASAAAANSVGVNVGNGNLAGITIGGSTPADRNVISGNNGAAIILNSSQPVAVLGNYLGVNGAGTAALANSGPGIVIGTLGVPTLGGPRIGGVTATPGTGAGNVISGNGLNGIQIQTSLSTTVLGAGTIEGNLIGLDATGATAIPNTGTGILIMDGDLPNSGVGHVGPITIGGSAVGARNVISGHGTGIIAQAVGTVIQNNFIGTDASGTLARPNQFGIEIRGGGAFAGSAMIGDVGGLGFGGNVISGNLSDAVRIFLSTATLHGNRIGTSATGGPLGNGGLGVFVDSGLAAIGGTGGGTGNVIANNGDMGVQVRIGFAAVHNASEASILGNSITANAQLGINNSVPDLVTPNDLGDGDAGPNDLQNFPVITAATIASGNVSISGTLNSTPSSNFRLEFFSSPSCDGSGFGEGATYLGFQIVTTDASGDVAFGPLSFPIPAGETSITATATNGAFHTSEFSSCRTATGGPVLPTLSLTPVSANEGNAGTTPFVFTATLSGPTPTPLVLNYTTIDGTATTASGDYTFASGTLTFSPGGPLSQTITVDVQGDTTAEPNETFTLAITGTLSASATGTIVNDDSTSPPPPPAEIPTLSWWGVLALGIALALFGASRLSRSGAVAR